MVFALPAGHARATLDGSPQHLEMSNMTALPAAHVLRPAE